VKRMMYRCDACGCYLDTGEGRICDECRQEAERRVQKMKRVSEAVRLGSDNQYELIMEEVS